MDYVVEMQLRNQFKNLDGALQRNDRLGASLAMDEINRLIATQRPKPGERTLTAGLPNWVQQMIADQGLRLRALENALNVQRVVVKPMFGKESGYGVKLEFRF